MKVINDHPPIHQRQVGRRKSPWINHDLIRKIRKRNYLCKKAKTSNDESTWELFKPSRNEVKHAIKSAKHNHFKRNLDKSKKDPRTTWKLINDLTSRKCKSNHISEINPDGKTANKP